MNLYVMDRVLVIKQWIVGNSVISKVCLQPGFDVVEKELFDSILQDIHQNIALGVLTKAIQHLIPDPLVIDREHFLNVLKHPLWL